MCKLTINLYFIILIHRPVIFSRLLSCTYSEIFWKRTSHILPMWCVFLPFKPSLSIPQAWIQTRTAPGIILCNLVLSVLSLVTIYEPHAAKLILHINYTIIIYYRLVVDEWLELKFPSPETGQGVLSAVQTLRSMWSHLLEMKLQASQCENTNMYTSIKELVTILWDWAYGSYKLHVVILWL